MSKRTDINKGALLATLIAAIGIGLAARSLWAFIMSGIALYAVLAWLRIVRHSGPTKRFTRTARPWRARRR